MKSPTLLTLLFAATAHAQHDAHREAVIDIANGRMEPARERLEKLFDHPESLWRDVKGPYARVAETLREKGDTYRELVAPETHYTLAMLHSLEGDGEMALTHARAAVSGGLPFERFLAGPREAFQALYAREDFQAWSRAEAITLLHGPMLGNVTHEAVSFWVRTASESQIEIHVEAMQGGKTKSASGRTSADADYTAVVRVDGLRADTAHRYRVRVDGVDIDLPTASFRTSPPPGEGSMFQIAFTACAGYAPEHERVWKTIEKQNPQALLMLGDNVYIDDPEHDLTQHFCYYRRFSRPEWRSLVAGRGVYAIWDDHDFGLNDSFGGPTLDQPSWKREVWDVFTQNWNNPSYGGGIEQPGVWFDFHIGDVHFIMLDGRYYREEKSRRDTRSMLGPAQLAWLKKTLKNSQATFRVLASPVPWAEGSTAGANRFDKWDGFIAERDDIFDFIHAEKIAGVVLLSGDRHRSDARRIDREHGYPLYDFMSAIPTNYHTHPVVKSPGMLFGHNAKNSFGLLRFDTTAEDPSVTCEFVCIDGEPLWTHTLRLSELGGPAD